MNKNYEMSIDSIFQLDSRNLTAFGGKLKSFEKERIVDSQAHLIIDGKVEKVVSRVYEVIFSNGLRSLETYDRVNLTQKFIDNHDCKLVGID